MDFSLSSSLVGSAVSNPDKLALDLQFATDKTLTARKGPTPVFTRASTGRFVGSNGLIQSAAINAPRFDHDPVTGVCKGLLMEESRTNSLAYSEDFANAYWSRSNAITPSNTSIAPNGNSVNTSLLATATVYPSINRTISITTGSTITLSVFAKQLTTSVFSLELRGTGSAPDATFDLINGTATGIGVITPFGNGWYRCSISKVINATTVIAIIGLGATAVVGNSILIWGAQLELGSFPTSYITTTGASVIRSADVCSITGSAFSGFYNQPSGTLESEVMIANLIGNNRGIVQIDDNTNNSVLRHFYGLSDGGFRTIIRANADAATTLSATLGTASVIQKRALAYEGTSFASVTNGGAVTTITRTMPVGLSILRIGNLAEGSFYLSGHIAAIRYYKKRLSNAKLQAITV